MVQWLGLGFFTARPGLIPDWGTRILHTTWCGQKKKKSFSKYLNHNPNLEFKLSPYRLLGLVLTQLWSWPISCYFLEHLSPAKILSYMVSPNTIPIFLPLRMPFPHPKKPFSKSPPIEILHILPGPAQVLPISQSILDESSSSQLKIPLNSL